MMSQPRALTLRHRLLRLMIVASFAAFAIVAVAVVVYEQTTFKPRAVTNLRQQSDTLAAVVLPPLEFSDLRTAEQYLATRRRYPDIIAVALYTVEDGRVATYERDVAPHLNWPMHVPDYVVVPAKAAGAPNELQPDVHDFSSGKLHLWYPVEGHGRTVGYLLMCAEIAPLYARLPQYGIMAGAVLLALLAVAGILTRGLRRSFLEPIERLTAVTEQVTHHKDYGLRAPIQQADEVGRLAAGLNEMLATVALRDQALQHSEARMRSIIETEPECVKVISSEGILLEVNPAGLVMLEVASLQEALQKPLLEYVAAEHRVAFKAMFQQVMQGASDGIEFELIGLRGGRRWLETRAVPMHDERSATTAVLAISRDITERKGFERALNRRTEQQAAIVKLGIEALSAQSFDAFLQRASEVVAGILCADYAVILESVQDRKIALVRAAHGWKKWQPGYEWRVEPGTPTERVLTGEAALHIQDFASDMRFPERVRQHRYDFRSLIAVRIRTPSLPWGLIAVHSKHPHAFTDDDVNALQEIANLLAQAIQRIAAETAQRAIEAQLLQSQKMDALGRLAGGIAHDFNNLLSAILGNAQLAREDVGAGHSSIVSLEQIENAGRRAKELVQRILAFSRQQAPRREPLRLDPIIEEVARLLRATIPARVAVSVDIAHDLPLVAADSAQIHQTLLNLGTNAWQAIGGAGGRIELSAVACEAGPDLLQAHPALKPGIYVCVTISDTGTGIATALQRKIFDPFFTTKPLGEGTGLGLSVVLGIMQAHGGAVTVASEPGLGAKFRLYFPSAKASEAVIAIESEPRSLGRGTGERILYLDDEESLVFLATRLLERVGYQVEGFTKAEHALTAFRANPNLYRLVITDLSMPGMSGMDVAREVLALQPNAVVVLASGYLRQADIDAATALGIREVVLKPNTVDELAPIVQRLLANTQGVERGA